MPDSILKVSNIEKSFGALKASDGISLDLVPGEIHALIGPNGAGKSTLIKQIAGGLKPDAGSVQFLGHEITGMSTAQRARLGLGRTFQISALAMGFTVLENAVLGAVGQSGSVFRFFKPAMKDAALLARARSALDRVNLRDYENVVTSELSHGQRRQLEVAVALTLGSKFGVLTEKRERIAMKERHVRRAGLTERLASIRALGLSTADLDARPEETVARGMDLARRIPGVLGAVIVHRGKVGAWGMVELVSLEDGGKR